MKQGKVTYKTELVDNFKKVCLKQSDIFYKGMQKVIDKAENR